MRFLVGLFLIAILSFAACTYFPWWSIAVAGFIVFLIVPINPGAAFLSGLCGVFSLWFTMSLLISAGNEHIMARRFSMLVLSSESPLLLILITGLIGGIVGGLGSLSGALIRNLFKPVKV